jgi:hypothetical protein
METSEATDREIRRLYNERGRSRAGAIRSVARLHGGCGIGLKAADVPSPIVAANRTR